MAFKYLTFLFLYNVFVTALPTSDNNYLSSNNLNVLMSVLKNMEKNSVKKPIILLVNPEADVSSVISNEAGDTSAERNNENSSPKRLSQSSTSEEGSLEPEQKTVLRAALRARCRKVNTCQKKCPAKPRKVSYTCKVSCQENIDEENLCEQKSPCKKKNNCGGRTFPPKWLL